MQVHIALEYNWYDLFIFLCYHVLELNLLLLLSLQAEVAEKEQEELERELSTQLQRTNAIAEQILKEEEERLKRQAEEERSLCMLLLRGFIIH